METCVPVEAEITEMHVCTCAKRSRLRLLDGLNKDSAGPAPGSISRLQSRVDTQVPPRFQFLSHFSLFLLWGQERVRWYLMGKKEQLQLEEKGSNLRALSTCW